MVALSARFQQFSNWAAVAVAAVAVAAVAVAELLWLKGVESKVEVPQIQFIDKKCPSLRTDLEIARVQFLDKVVHVAARLCIDKIVDVPVITQARAVHMEILDMISTSSIWQSLLAVFMLQNTEAFGRISC